MQTLISAKQLKTEMTGQNLIILDSRFYLTDLTKGKKEYQKGHIEGAIFVDVHESLASEETPLTGRHPLPNEEDFARYLSSLGIDRNSRVVVYDDMSGSISARMWWMLAQNEIDVRVLDGGIQSWLALGLPLSKDVPLPKAQEKQMEIHFPWQVSEEEVLVNIESEDFTLLDARAEERYLGEAETIDPIAGHIPGAHNHPFSKNLSKTGCFLPVKDLLASFDSLNVEGPVVNYCGSGITACHNVLASVIAGKNNIRVYVGSWSQWSKRMLRLMLEEQES